MRLPKPPAGQRPRWLRTAKSSQRGQRAGTPPPGPAIVRPEGGRGTCEPPLAAEAQPAGRPRLCFLTFDSGTPQPSRFDPFFQGLRDLGHVDGQSITIDYLSADGRGERFPVLAADCLRLKADNGDPAKEGDTGAVQRPLGLDEAPKHQGLVVQEYDRGLGLAPGEARRVDGRRLGGADLVTSCLTSRATVPCSPIRGVTVRMTPASRYSTVCVMALPVIPPVTTGTCWDVTIGTDVDTLITEAVASTPRITRSSAPGESTSGRLTN
jgi:hypothetical protein